jgi:hypothetical protein
MQPSRIRPRCLSLRSLLVAGHVEGRANEVVPLALFCRRSYCLSRARLTTEPGEDEELPGATAFVGLSRPTVDGLLSSRALLKLTEER